jgi:hypothetical protein
VIEWLEPFCTIDKIVESWNDASKFHQELHGEFAKQRGIYSSDKVFKVLAAASEGNASESGEDGACLQRWTYLVRVRSRG